MRILVVDNISLYSKDVVQALAGHEAYRIAIEDFRAPMATDVDAVVLTGSRMYNVLKNKEDYAEQRRSLLSTTPHFGICAGHQLLCSAYGATLHKLERRIRGVQPFMVSKDDPLFEGLTAFCGYQSHLWSVENAPDLDVLAGSEQGVEVVRVPGTLTYGTQFHPEIRDEQNEGYKLLQNWVTLVSASLQKRDAA